MQRAFSKRLDTTIPAPAQSTATNTARQRDVTSVQEQPLAPEQRDKPGALSSSVYREKSSPVM